LLLATVVSALNSSKYLGTQSDVLLTCSVRAITLVLFFHRVLWHFWSSGLRQNDRYSYSEHGSLDPYPTTCLWSWYQRFLSIQFITPITSY
jgi:hypothetical protein